MSVEDTAVQLAVSMDDVSLNPLQKSHGGQASGGCRTVRSDPALKRSAASRQPSEKIDHCSLLITR